MAHEGLWNREYREFVVRVLSVLLDAEEAVEPYDSLGVPALLKIRLILVVEEVIPQHHVPPLPISLLSVMGAAELCQVALLVDHARLHPHAVEPSA
eukprot:CAMPEP_0182453258 /NCGR_PEP_ID=MMETSP1319-20130603/396_1 /TAXON_ID=172717 /ORGANISM="Bolidomonas pacifica, Strain RCC208" /LENGTH=95 /DNA_ID=CAMNT_0024651167 /DNA_START=118 /DNA_END=405 /DNA_ORIENTATION=+